YNINPQEGDKTLYIQQAQNSESRQEIHRGERASITYNSNYAVFLIKPFYKDIKKHRVEKKKGKSKKELTKDSLGIYNYQKNNIDKIADVTGYKLPKKNGSYLAYTQEIKEEKTEEKEDAESDTTDVKSKNNSDSNEKIKQLVLRRLS